MPSIIGSPRRGMRPPRSGAHFLAAIRGRLHVLPLVLLIATLLLAPPEARVTIAGLNFPTYRFATIATVAWALFAFGKGSVRLGVVDGLVLVCSAWMVLAFATVYDSSRGVYSGAANWLDVAGSYLIARAAVRTPEDLRTVLKLIAVPLFLAAAGLLLESMNGRLIVRPLAAAIFGTLPNYEGGNVMGQLVLDQEYRLGGLLRAYSVFSHPILAGSILASTIPIYWYSGLRPAYRMAGLAGGFLAFFSVSSAALIAIALSLACISVETARKRIRSASWWSVTVLVTLVAAAAQIASQNGIINVIIRYTFDPQTAAYRVKIWQFGAIAVRENPWFGVGYEEYARNTSELPSGSVDAHFLALALSSGLVACYALLAATIYAMVKLGVATAAGRGRDRNLLLAVNISLFILFFASMTVTFFNEARIWFMIVIALAASMGQLVAVKRHSPANRPPAAAPIAA